MALASIDWFRVLTDLQHSGTTLNDVQRVTGISASTLRGYLMGSQPPHWRGERLIDLWTCAFGRSRDDLPTVTLLLTRRVATETDLHVDEEAVMRLQEAFVGRLHAQ